MPDWIFYPAVTLGVAAIVVSIVALTPLWEKLFPRTIVETVQANISPQEPNYDNTVRIRSEEPHNSPPVVYDISVLTCSFLSITGAAFVIYLAIVAKTVQQVSAITWLLFVAIVIAFPFWMIVDTLFVERKQRVLGRSRVAKEKTIDLDTDATMVFGKCLQIIHTRESSIITMERPKLIKARWRNSILTVTVTNLGHGRVRVYVTSDSQWTSTKWDSGKNQKNIDAFERLLHSEKVQ